MSQSDPTRRFSSRVENYARYRPRYPEAVIEILREACGLEPAWTVADIGSGTGLLSEVLLGNGNPVLGVEPNREMRAVVENPPWPENFPRFTSVEGTAEETTLSSNSVDLVTAGQAFHWFDPVRACAEFRRILKPDRQVALIWNERRIEDDPVQQDYETLLLQFGTDYRQVGFQHRVDEDSIDRFFPGDWTVRKTENVQLLGLGALKGRLLSASYTPEFGTDTFEPMLESLNTIFDRHQKDGIVRMKYWTTIYSGRVE